MKTSLLGGASSLAIAFAISLGYAASGHAADGIDVQNAFFTSLKEKAQEAAQGTITAKIIPVQLGQYGEFKWFWRSNEKFNALTYDYVSARVDGTNPKTLALQGSFGNDYEQVIRAISWTLSSADTVKLNDAATKTALQADAVVSSYQQNVGNITDAQLTACDVTKKIDYIINCKVATTWACSTTPIPMANIDTRNLRSKLACTPASGMPVLNPIAEWLDLNTAVLPIQDQVMSANYTRKTVLANLTQPTINNGGITTVNTSGVDQVRVGYNIGAAPTAIQNDLANTGRAISIDMAISSLDQKTANVSIGGSAGVIGWGFLFGWGATTSVEKTINSYQGAGSEMTASLSYKGLSFVPVTRANYAQDTGKGWYYADMIAQAAKNVGADVSGYKFQTTPPYNLAANGNFGVVDVVMISQYPTITITYKNGSYEEFSQSFKQETNTGFSLFGIRIGGQESIYNSSLSKNSQAGTFTVTFTPSKEVLTVPDLEKTTNVIGASVVYPGAFAAIN